MPTVDKRSLVAHLRASVARDLEAATRAATDAAEAATHEENKPENDKDMRSTEASYLARGQAERVRELERCDAVLRSLSVRPWRQDEPVAAGALVVVERDGASAAYLVAPAGGGMRAPCSALGRDGAEVQVVTPQSPMGQALLGRAVGDTVHVRGAGGEREWEIVDVQ